ncbi:helix-turn-helix domain-containing protein [Microbacterium jejuense]|uniref:Helix-turn-helix domain-containing protein n=1 Tax=Microbacterium jejuense TaxID=1263637 RepID=A0ABS7HMZ1_9MICO|nr:helix-turn-helix domain-containing protein [Microbacterium jejuense]MBW9094296.1 helix-turn-helix domain-containing protein [Microbacterium jejuense]
MRDRSAELRARCAALIDDGFADPRLDARTLAALLGVSRRHLDRAHQGHDSIGDLLTRRRLQSVATLVAASPATSLAAAAAQSGFSSYETFRRQRRLFATAA